LGRLELVVQHVETFTRRRVENLRTAVGNAHRVVPDEYEHTPVMNDVVTDPHLPQFGERTPHRRDRHRTAPVRSLKRGRIRRMCAFVELAMLGPWLQDLESLEAISQNDEARRIFLKMAAMSHDGRLPNFIAELNGDEDVDDETKGHLTELANDRAFLLAVEEYLRRTQRIH
jgi:hypothetical protein